ncbi:MAG TPA: class III extradiol ring-cleavage dioxygenase [Bryobacteraceae bacterium]|nr:class III extradiol ring-cleavage dioxygenase [Bryobacteraceae bacterium]
MAEWLRQVPELVGSTPQTVLVISGHWEEEPLAVTSNPAPPLLYDYYGFPEHTYQLKYPAPGSPGVAARVGELLAEVGFPVKKDAARGFDHGVFIPFKLIYPDANIPIVQLSLRQGLNAADHIRIGHALAPLRREGVLIVGSGMSFHNLRAFGSAAGPVSDQFDEWLTNAVCTPDPQLRDDTLAAWIQAPAARLAHPREEHLLPLMVAAGAAESEQGRKLFQDRVMGVTVSAFGFGL